MTKETPSHALPTTLTQADFEAVADHCYRTARKIVAKGDAVEPILLMGMVRDGTLKIPSVGRVPVQSTSDKECLMALMQALVQQLDVDFVVHITEAWLLVGQTLPEGSIAEHPQRQEAVLFNIMSKDCQTVVINPLHRKPSRLERGKVDFDQQFEGRLVRPAPSRN